MTRKKIPPSLSPLARRMCLFAAFAPFAAPPKPEKAPNLNAAVFSQAEAFLAPLWTCAPGDGSKPDLYAQCAEISALWAGSKSPDAALLSELLASLEVPLAEAWHLASPKDRADALLALGAGMLNESFGPWDRAGSSVPALSSEQACRLLAERSTEFDPDEIRLFSRALRAQFGARPPEGKALALAEQLMLGLGLPEARAGSKKPKGP